MKMPADAGSDRDQTSLGTLLFLERIMRIPAKVWGILDSEHTQQRTIVAVVDGGGELDQPQKSSEGE